MEIITRMYRCPAQLIVVVMDAYGKRLNTPHHRTAPPALKKLGLSDSQVTSLWESCPMSTAKISAEMIIWRLAVRDRH